MTSDQITELFEKHNDEYLKFSRIENPPSKRPDLCAFIKLDQIVPAKTDIVSAAEHDEIYLSPALEELGAATEEDIIYLIRCGARIDSYGEGLAMFV